jgi:hypothetical protein
MQPEQRQAVGIAVLRIPEAMSIAGGELAFIESRGHDAALSPVLIPGF